MSESRRNEILRHLQPHTSSREAVSGGRGIQNRHTDARDIRQTFGFPPFNPGSSRYPQLTEDCLIHEWEPQGERDAYGGTDWFAVGKPGSGKSTLALAWSAHLMEQNRETVVWRGSERRAEWLPFAPWATVAIPAGVSVSAHFEKRDPSSEKVEVRLEDVVRDVVRYRDPVHLNQDLLQPGQFHVVYPDPDMTGLQAIYEKSDYTVEPPADRDALFHPEDPNEHWWFGWAIARIEEGPYSWCSWICDEVRDLLKEGARNDQFGTYQKIELYTEAYSDFRKYGLSAFKLGHREQDLHSMVKDKIRWRISMPKSANPTSKGQVGGFEAVPMKADQTSKWQVGRALIFNESKFERITWPDIPSPVGDWKLKVRLDR